MRNVTDLFQYYRVSLRELWNTQVWAREDLRGPRSVDRFRKAKRLLFEAMVLEPLSFSRQPGTLPAVEEPRFIVIPHVPTSNGGEVGIAAHIIVLNSEQSGRRSVECDLGYVQSADTELQFVDCFNWNDEQYWDLVFFLVKIRALKTNPELVGREALVKVHQVDVFVEDSL